MHGPRSDYQGPALADVLSAEEAKELHGTSIVAVDYGRLTTLQGTWQENLAQLIELLATIPGLETVQQEQWAADRMTEARAVLADLEADRQREVRPLIDQKAEIDLAYRSTTKPLNDFVAAIKKALDHAAAARLKVEEEKRLVAATLAAAGDDEGCQQALAVLSEPVKIAGASTSHVWRWREVDLAKAPREYTEPKAKALDALCKTHDKLNTPPTIPGFEFYKEASTRATTRRSK